MTVNFKVKYLWVKDCVNEISLIYNIIYGGRHSKPFTNKSCFVGHPVIWIKIFCFQTKLCFYRVC